MSFIRSEFLRPLVREYVKRNSAVEGSLETNLTSQSPLILFNDSSSSVNKMYMRNSALSIFGLETVSFFPMNINLTCFPHRFIHRYDHDHNNSHLNPEDFEENHYHLVKLRSNDDNSLVHQKMSLDDLQCVFKHLRSQLKKAGLCPKKTNCTLSSENIDTAKSAYLDRMSLLEDKKKNHELIERICADLEVKFIQASKSFAKGFYSTFFDNYLQPYLINVTHRPLLVKALLESTQAAFMLAFTSSILNVTLDFAIRNAFKLALEKFGLDAKLISKITTQASIAMTIANNPLSLIEAGINGCSAGVGQALAFQMIHHLPKLKEEDIALHPEIVTPKVFLLAEKKQEPHAFFYPSTDTRKAISSCRRRR